MTSESSAEFTKVAYDVLCFYTNIDCSFFFLIILKILLYLIAFICGKE